MKLLWLIVSANLIFFVELHKLHDDHIIACFVMLFLFQLDFIGYIVFDYSHVNANQLQYLNALQVIPRDMQVEVSINVTNWTHTINNIFKVMVMQIFEWIPF